jgi:hypothetical protein
MALVSVNWQPDQKQLRQFALSCAVALTAAAWLGATDTRTIGWLAGLGLAFYGLTWIYPHAIRPLYLACSVITLPIGLAISELVMMIVFAGVFLPMSLWFRWRGRDRLQRRLDSQAETYWQVKRPPKALSSYYRQS